MKWQPIETAPWEVRVLFYEDMKGICIGERDPLCGFQIDGWLDNDCLPSIRPTHWMPLPDGPEASQ